MKRKISVRREINDMVGWIVEGFDPEKIILLNCPE